MHAPPRMCAVVGVPTSVSVAIVIATPPTFSAKRVARSVASAMNAVGALVPGSSAVTRPSRMPVNIERPSSSESVPSSVRM